jgi:caspase domain-containing protein
MPRMFLILALFIITHIASTASSSWAIQDARPLTLRQIEQSIESGIDDEVIAREIGERGLAFRLSEEKLEQLIKRGAGARTRQALLLREERAAYAAYLNENQDPAKRLALGKEFLRRHPRSEHAAEIESGNRSATLEIFNTAYKAFSANPGAASLDRLLARGREILSQSPDRSVAAQVTTQLAVATGRGMIGDFYSDLDQSQAYANQALELLEETTSALGLDAAEYAKLRANIYQCQGLYLLRQQNPDAERAIDFLSKAAQSKDSPSAGDPNTYWLRALAYDLIYEKLIDKYQALPKGRRGGKQGQSICAEINPIAGKLIEDYTRVISLSEASGARQLHDEALIALKSLLTTDRPCLAGRTELLDELPAKEKRFALVIGVEDYLDERAGKFNYAASDARAVADTLTQRAGFRKDRIVLLATGEPADRQPLRSVILRRLASLPDLVSDDGLLLIYFSGHVIERGGKNYLLPSDALTGDDALLAETAISVERIKELIRASGAGQVMLIFDSFRKEPLSEGFTRGLTLDTRNQEAAAFAMLLPTGVGQRAYESQTKKQGYFTAALIEALKGRPAGGAGGVTLDRLVNYLQANVQAEAQRDLGAGAEQRPMAIIEGYKSDELAMATSEGGAAPAKPEPAELIRAARTVHIQSKTIYLKPKLLEAELLKQPDFQALGLKIVPEAKDADLVVDVTLPFLTWMWTYVVTHQASATRLANGRIRELTAGLASPKLAKDMSARLQALRTTGK